MRLLVCNDDGIQSEGMIVLAKMLCRDHNVTVIAPNVNRTANAHAMTVGKPLKLEKCEMCPQIEAFSFEGTPADCVKFGLYRARGTIDAVISGINRGANIGTDTLYSGTLSAAIEAIIFDVPSIALSCEGVTSEDYAVAVEICRTLIPDLLSRWQKGITWNVNFPDIKRGKPVGIRFTPLGVNVYSDHYEHQGDERYALFGEPVVHDGNPKDCDVELIKKQYVTVTPILLNRTSYDVLNELKDKEVRI